MANVDYLVNSLIKLEDRDKLLRSIAFGVLSEMKKRIHDRGQRANGSPIGKYSDSYLRLREKKGRDSDSKVIFSFTGQMENDFKIIAISDSEYGLGFDNEFNALKSEVLEYGQTPHTVKDHTRRTKDGKTVEVTSYFNKGSRGFGTDIYILSERELEIIEQVEQSFINDSFA